MTTEPRDHPECLGYRRGRFKKASGKPVRQNIPLDTAGQSKEISGNSGATPRLQLKLGNTLTFKNHEENCKDTPDWIWIDLFVETI